MAFFVWLFSFLFFIAVYLSVIFYVASPRRHQPNYVPASKKTVNMLVSCIDNDSKGWCTHNSDTAGRVYFHEGLDIKITSSIVGNVSVFIDGSKIFITYFQKRKIIKALHGMVRKHRKLKEMETTENLAHRILNHYGNGQ